MSYCCLGVLCDLAGAFSIIRHEYKGVATFPTDDDSIIESSTLSGLARRSFDQIFGSYEPGITFQGQLIKMNDVGNKTFADIAQAIEDTNVDRDTVIQFVRS